MDDGQVEKIVKDIVRWRESRGEGNFIPFEDILLAFCPPTADRPPEGFEFDIVSAQCCIRKMGYEEVHRPYAGYEKVSAQQSVSSEHIL